MQQYYVCTFVCSLINNGKKKCWLRIKLTHRTALTKTFYLRRSHPKLFIYISFMDEIYIIICANKKNPTNMFNLIFSNVFLLQFF